jgi:hypothetical protein
MTPGIRKFTLTTHITLSVGWIGAAGAYLVLAIAAMTTPDALTVRAAWIAMELVGWRLIVPLALTSLLTGIVISLGTSWGLVRHYWVLSSLALTTVATAVLLRHMQTVSVFAGVAARTDSTVVDELRGALGGELLHAGLGVAVLLVIEALNVYKPRGVTAYGRRHASEAPVPSRPRDDANAGVHPRLSPGMPRWVQVVGVHAIALGLLVVIVHLAGGGLRLHPH